MKDQLHTSVDKTLMHNFRDLVLDLYGKNWGSIQKGVDEALRDFLKKYGRDPDEPIPVTEVKKKLSHIPAVVLARG